MHVELLYTEADPTYMTVRQTLVEVLNEDAFETPIQMIAVASMADARLLGFTGSPTIRIDGVDIDPTGARGISLGRRRYPGSSDGGPDKRLIRAAVERARGWRHGRLP
ncbi:MAG: hypothetical protein E6I62_00285 [Chloroflexi bacterium]|nr:MAG: hypothetical protein E6I62_00285 [Chloroflexota bacterium]